MQIVYISNRSDISRETLVYVENLMPFVTEAVFVCPGDQVKDFRFSSRISVRVVDEGHVLGPEYGRFKASRDHQFKNCLLRFSLARLSDLGEEFIMSDDDNRPLKEIPLSFYKTFGRYRAYCYYDAKRWPWRQTDYDRGQRETGRILEALGYDTRSYSSHMPQVINKVFAREAAETFQEMLDQGVPLDEWSVYFNYGQKDYPNRFHAPEPFKTLCWPAFPSDWPLDVRPVEYCFENFYPAVYQNDLYFSDFSTAFDAENYRAIAEEKIRRRVALQNAFEAGDLSIPARALLLFRDVANRFPVLNRIPSGVRLSLLSLLCYGSKKQGVFHEHAGRGNQVNRCANEMYGKSNNDQKESLTPK